MGKMCDAWCAAAGPATRYSALPLDGGPSARPKEKEILAPAAGRYFNGAACLLKEGGGFVKAGYNPVAGDAMTSGPGCHVVSGATHSSI